MVEGILIETEAKKGTACDSDVRRHIRPTSILDAASSQNSFEGKGQDGL
jgi:hypothetical protein